MIEIEKDELHFTKPSSTLKFKVEEIIPVVVRIKWRKVEEKRRAKVEFEQIEQGKISFEVKLNLETKESPKIEHSITQQNPLEQMKDHRLQKNSNATITEQKKNT